MALSKKWLLRMQADNLDQSSKKIYRKNMTALKEQDAELHQRIEALSHDTSYSFIKKNPKDLYNLSLPNEQGQIVSYYDTEDILASVEQTFSKQSTRNRSLIIMCGIGLGYELLTFLNLHAQSNLRQTLFIIEKDPQIFKKCLEVTDLSSAIENPLITFSVGRNIPDFTADFHDYITPFERMTLLKAIAVILPDPCLKLHAAYYSDTLQAIKTSAIYTTLKYGNSPEDSLVGEKHMFQNVKNILTHPGINMLYGKFTGKPAIVCASGPSLTAELPLLKTLQDQALILSAESTFWALQAHGIHPHIMCTLERVVRPTGYFDKFSYDDVKNTYLAAVPVVPPNMYESYLGPKINAYRLYNHFHWLPFDKGTLDIKKSSANMAFKLAHMLGCSPIILLGQDLCFDRDTHITHVKEHHFGADQKHLHEQRHIDVPANDGQMAKTTEVWLEFLQGYTIDVRDYGGDVINCSAKGAYIEGTRYMPFSQAVADYLQKPYDAAPIIRDTFASFTMASIHTDLHLLSDRLHTALTDLTVMIETCLEGVHFIDDFIKHNQDAINNLNFSALEQRSLNAAQKKIDTLKKSIISSETFKLLVLHVVQSYIISFEMNMNERYVSLENDESITLFTVVRYREYFASMAAMVDMIKRELENARDITAELLKGLDNNAPSLKP